jgi:UDP-glucose 4-epimerase
MRILITGGAGFIGSHLAEAYVAAGHEVAVLDNLSTGKLENLAGTMVRFYEVDITDRDGVRMAMADFKPEVVSHHAAQMSVKVSTDRPVFDAEQNVTGLLNVLESAVEHKVRKVIFASSGGTVYGDAEWIPTPEYAPMLPMSPYGITKMAGEHYLRYFHRSFGLDYTVFRYGNVYGPRQDPHGEAGVVAIFAKKLLSGQSPTIHWDGEQRKDYVHVKDVAHANVLALTEGSARAYNIGAGEATSVNELFDQLEGRLKTGISPTYGPRREGDVRLSYLDVSRANVELHWEPIISLEEGMVDTVAFFRQQVATDAKKTATR